jgi:hypothetical protein
MTLALLGVGLCHVTTALALRPAGTTGRILLGAGGIATMMVAATPLPVRGDSVPHTVAAGVAFLALGAWPAVSWRTPAPAWPLGRDVSLCVAGLLLALVGWFAAELVAVGPRIGLAERVAAGAEAAWPLLVAVSARRSGAPCRADHPPP